jgi:hypothetical protein
VTADGFVVRTFRWQDWSLSEPEAAKEARRQTVSLVVPARGEAATVGDVVSRVPAGLARPLAGEWAFRRSLFETLSVSTGYAVEMTALIDTWRWLGADAVARVQLGRRTHRRRVLHDLAAMATQILAATWSRATDQPPADTVLLRQHVLVDGAPVARAAGLIVRASAREVPILTDW